eukprot:GFYU01003260.1.p3 GENE.GFYU01003260.1~~GFYU01003260.1.p3  ORF type:complete len:130 (+),score=53.29 GFYU01003260.1:35-424(+)
MQAPSKEVDVEVTREDQKRINTFSSLNTKYHTLKDELKEKREESEKLKDALQDIYLVDADEDPIQFKVGECFVEMGFEDSESKLEDISAKVEEEVEAMDKELGDIRLKMDELKVILQAKFKDSINLEEE